MDFELAHGRRIDDPDLSGLSERRRVALLLRSGATKVEDHLTSGVLHLADAVPRTGALPTLMRWAARLLHEADDFITGPRLSAGALEILTLLRDCGPLTAAQITDKLDLHRATESRQRQELVNAGLVQVSPSGPSWGECVPGAELLWEAVEK